MKKLLSKIQIALAILAVHLAPIAAAGTLDTWTWRNPEPTGNNLSGVANGVVNGTSEFVAVGYESTILTSQNGTTWYQQSTPANLTLTGIAFGGTTFVAVGLNAINDNPVILTSSDGSTWTQNTGNLGTKGLLAVSYGGGMFVAVGYGGAVLTSPDGSIWTTQNSMVGNTLDSVAHGVINGVEGFVAVGSSGGIFTSTDGGGATWTSSISGTPYTLAGVTYGNGVWAVVGQSIFLRSFNGTAWGSTMTGYPAVAVTYDTNDSLFVAWGNSEQPGLFTSTNGISWKIQGPATAGTTALFNALTYDSTYQTFVAVGGGGGIATSTSVYGTNWLYQEQSVTAEPLNAVAFGNFGAIQVFVTGGGILGGNTGTMLYSFDGVIWSAGKTNPNVLAGTVVYGITYGSSSGIPLFVAVGTAYAGGPPNAEVLTSQDAINWSLTYTNGPGVYINQLNAVAFGNGEFVAVGSGGAILTSPDAVNWTQQTSHTTSGLNGVTYGGGLCVAVETGGGIVTSPDGANWTVAAPGPNYALYGVAYGNGSYVAVGESSSYYPVIMTSHDGASWSATYTGPTAYYYLSAITFNNGTFAATGQNGQILTSPDGSTWTARSSGTGNQLSAVVFGESEFIAVGASGTILGTGPQILLQFSHSVVDYTTGTINLSVTGPPGSPVNLQSSIGDLLHFATTQSTTFDSSGNASFSDTVTPSTSVMFYRLQIP